MLSDFYAGPIMAIAQGGYRKGLEKAGLPFDSKLVKTITVEHMKLAEKAMDQVRELIAAKADAIVAVSDLIAAAILKCLLKLAVRVPEDIAIIGCDNLDVAGLVSPGLTTFEQNNDQLAIKLVDLLSDLIEDRPIPPERRNVAVRSTMIKRESA